jgi:hypothetical protein
MEKSSKGIYGTGLAIVSILLVLSMPISGLKSVLTALQPPIQTASANTESFTAPNPALSNQEQQAIVDQALNAPGVKAWSANGWQYVSMDFMGVKDPSVQWQYAVVNLHLPPNVQTAVACDTGWWAMVKVDLATKKVVSEDEPTKDSAICHSELNGGNISVENTQPVSVLDAILPQANAAAGYSVARENDVTSYSIYGNIAKFATPSYNAAIFTHENKYIEQLLNANWNRASSFTQAGWVITHISGCTGCGISANTASLAFVDQSVYGDFNLRGISYSWVNGQTELAEVLCNGGANYLIAVGYGSNIFNHTTNVPCNTTQNNDTYNNSVFFENANTVSSSTWSADVTGTVNGFSAYEFRNSQNTASTWLASTNSDVSCTGVPSSSTVITGNIQGGGTATWSTLSNVPVAC